MKLTIYIENSEELTVKFYKGVVAEKSSYPTLWCTTHSQKIFFLYRHLFFSFPGFFTVSLVSCLKHYKFCRGFLAENHLQLEKYVVEIVNEFLKK